MRHADVEIIHWNYRVRSYTAFTGVPGVEPQEQFDIIEVYYADDGVTPEGTPVAWGNTTGAMGETVDELRRDLRAMLDACEKPVLAEDDLPGARKESADG